MTDSVSLGSNNANEPLVSIIVPNHNGGELAMRCVESLLNSDYQSMRVVFVDNSSTDNCLDELTARFGTDARLKILSLDKNNFFSAAVSRGIPVVESEYVVFMNNDMITDPYWLKELVKAYEADPTVGAVQAKLLRMDDPTIMQYGGGLMNRLAFTRGRGVGRPEELFSSIDRVFFAAGACVLTSRKVLKEVGLPDTSFLVFDDADLGWRIRLRGYEVLFVPTARVMHRGSMTLDKSEFKETRSIQLIYEHYAMILKNYSFRMILTVLPSVLLLHLGRLFILIAERDLRIAKCTALGMIRALKLFPIVWLNRISVQRMRRVSDAHIVSLMKELSPDPLILFERHIGKLRLRVVTESGRMVLRLT